MSLVYAFPIKRLALEQTGLDLAKVAGRIERYRIRTGHLADELKERAHEGPLPPTASRVSHSITES